MKFLARVVPALLAALSLVQAASVALRNNNDFFPGFIDALNKNNLTTLADNYQKIAKTDEGKPIVDLLKTGEFTILAPENCAFDPKHLDIDPDIIKYSTLWGSIDKHFSTSDFTRRDAPYQTREPAPSTFPRRNNTGASKRTQSLDKFQVQVIDQFFTPSSWKRWINDPLVLIDRAVGNAKVVGRFTFQKIIVLIVDTVLTLPTTVSDLLCKPLMKSAPNGFIKFKEALEKTGLLDLVETKDKLTASLSPQTCLVDDTFCDDGTLSKDELASLLKNHFFFDPIVYTPLFSSVCKATAQSGKQLEFSFENSIHYVSCGKTRAMVLRGDVIPQNGVIHIIDRPLKCD
ncbi:hypothetical protein FRC11_004235 [Ceratobasidium sp. 423]|nr:hypothetical protein FRC11_004235 [Ceratobasidium sp. 423]